MDARRAGAHLTGDPCPLTIRHPGTSSATGWVCRYGKVDLMGTKAASWWKVWALLGLMLAVGLVRGGLGMWADQPAFSMPSPEPAWVTWQGLPPDTQPQVD